MDTSRNSKGAGILSSSKNVLTVYGYNTALQDFVSSHTENEDIPIHFFSLRTVRSQYENISVQYLVDFCIPI